MFASREAVQESIGFSPFELVFGHAVRGPLKVVKEVWLQDEPVMNLLDYVSDMRQRAHKAWEIARKNLTQAQSRMKTWFDKKTTGRKSSSSFANPISTFASLVQWSIHDHQES